MAFPWLQWSQNTKVEKSKEEANEASRVLYYVIDKKYYTYWQNPEDFLILTGMPCQITFPLQCKRLGFQMTGFPC